MVDMERGHGQHEIARLEREMGEMLPDNNAPSVAAIQHESPEEDHGQLGEVDGRAFVKDGDVLDPSDPNDPRAIYDAVTLEGGELGDVRDEGHGVEDDVDDVEKVWKDAG